MAAYGLPKPGEWVQFPLVARKGRPAMVPGGSLLNC